VLIYDTSSRLETMIISRSLRVPMLRRGLGLLKTIPKALRSSMRFRNEPPWIKKGPHLRDPAPVKIYSE
jgi:hypothetical protein